MNHGIDVAPRIQLRHVSFEDLIITGSILILIEIQNLFIERLRISMDQLIPLTDHMNLLFLAGFIE